MKQLNQYILEKLKINKESQKKSMFDEGDRCLRLQFFYENNKSFFIDVCTILEHHEDKCTLVYLLDETTKDQKWINRVGKCDYYYTGNENIVFREEKSKREDMIFLTKDEAKKFLDKLPKVDYKYNLTELFDAWSTKEDRTAQAYYVNTKEDRRWDKSHGWPDDGIKIIKDKLDEKPK